ncbi:unnamed protein product [Calypogeia fissa]
MATSLVAGLQLPILASSFSSGEDSLKETTRKSSRDSFRWLGPKKAIYGDYRISGQGIALRQRKAGTIPVLAAVGRDVPAEEDGEEESSPQDKASSELFRQQMEQMIVNDAKDARFEGKDLAQLIRNKYGRSYDVQLIKKEFFGRQLLAMNVMWKYREQRSFPLTEEEYLLHLDYIAQNLRGWGAVSFVRESLEKTKERPRIGKAVSIFINPDESGERAKEWINR